MTCCLTQYIHMERNKVKKKKKYMYVSSSTSIQKLQCTTRFYIFHFIGRKTAMRIFLINRTEQNTHKNNAVGRGPILYDICFANKSETDSDI